MIGDRERLAAAMVRVNALKAERDALQAQLDALTSDKAVEAASLALYELGRGEDWPGTIDGLRVRHVGTLLVAQVVLDAARKAMQG